MGVSHERDQQRQKLYNAENRARVTYEGEVKTWEVGDYAGVETYVNNLLKQKWVKRAFPKAPRSLVAKPLPGATSAYAHWFRGRISLPQGKGQSSATWAWNEWVVLHEVVHHVTGYYVGGGAHGWEFAKAFLRLVKNRMGVEAERHLKAAFKAGRVRYSKPRPPMSPEQKAAATARLAAGRDEALAKAREARRLKYARLRDLDRLHDDTWELRKVLTAQVAMAMDPDDGGWPKVAATAATWKKGETVKRRWCLPQPEVAAVRRDGARVDKYGDPITVSSFALAAG